MLLEYLNCSALFIYLLFNLHTYSADPLLSWEIVSVACGSFSTVLTRKEKKNINNNLMNTQRFDQAVL